ncbi:hypothetical protein F5B20DRAFT_229369 [Whalleya microplaca]|nr:hypothetical protein F5B20DRAFT_229369 [Whalleya microplaca]
MRDGILGHLTNGRSKSFPVGSAQGFSGALSRTTMACAPQAEIPGRGPWIWEKIKRHRAPRQQNITRLIKHYSSWYCMKPYTATTNKNHPLHTFQIDAYRLDSPREAFLTTAKHPIDHCSEIEGCFTNRLSLCPSISRRVFLASGLHGLRVYHSLSSFGHLFSARQPQVHSISLPSRHRHRSSQTQKAISVASRPALGLKV